MTRFPSLIALCGLAVSMLLASLTTAQSTSLQVTDHLTVPQWVNPATPGQLEGRVILPSTDSSANPIADAVVVMTNRDGETIRSRTDDAGRFVMIGVEPGVYALTARAKGAFACCAMHIVSKDMASSDVLPKQVEVAAAAIDYTVIKTSILRYLPPFTDNNPYSVTGANLKGISGRVVGENLFRVSQTDGGLKGRIYVAGAQGSALGDAGLLNVFLVSKGDVIDRVISRDNGSFEFENVVPGEYAILAIGQSGLGMAGFELVDEARGVEVSSNADDSLQTSQQSETLVTMQDPIFYKEFPGGFSIQIAPLSQAIESLEEVVQEEPLEEGEVVFDSMGTPVDQFGNPIGGVDQFGNPIGGVDQFGNPIGGSGFGDPGLGAGGGLSGGGGFAGGGGGGFGGGLGGLGGLASLGALAGLAGSGGSSDPILSPPPAASPIQP